MKRGDSKLGFSNAIGIIYHTVMTSHILLFSVIEKLTDIIDEKANDKNLVESISHDNDLLGIDLAGCDFKDIYDESVIRENMPCDTSLLTGDLAGWDFQNIHD